jgi:hypothetical protein
MLYLSRELPIPIGTQSAEMLGVETDLDLDSAAVQEGLVEDEATIVPEAVTPVAAGMGVDPYSEAAYRKRAQQVYSTYAGKLKSNFRWLRPELFKDRLKADLQADANALMAILQKHGRWDPTKDVKLQQLIKLVRDLDGKKVLIFTQFADTVEYLTKQLQAAGIPGVAGVTGQSENPTELVQRFSPNSNGVAEPALLAKPVDVLVATDVLSEGQNLQDCDQVVNFDLPWAIIRLIQRAGRVDRIGQQSPTITCYSFLPADGIEAIIRLRARVRQRLQENGEVVGSDEQFFEDSDQSQERRLLHELYTETRGVLDEEDDREVDLASYAFQIWRNATAANLTLKKAIEYLPNVVYGARRIDDPTAPITSLPFMAPRGVLVYLKSASGTDSLAWIDQHGNSVTQSQYAILRAAECTLATVSVERSDNHHDLVTRSFDLIEEREALGGGLGSPRGARFRLYNALNALRDYKQQHEPLFMPEDLNRVIDDVYRYPLRQSAADAINRQIRSGVSGESLFELVKALRDENKLSFIQDMTEDESDEPQIVCSLGLV